MKTAQNPGEARTADASSPASPAASTAASPDDATPESAAMDRAFRRLTALAAELLGAPAAALTLPEGEGEWFFARPDAGLGPEAARSAEAEAVRALALREPGPTAVRHAGPGGACPAFCAGAALPGSRGAALGTLMVLDASPRPAFDAAAAETLRRLAETAAAVLEGQRAAAALGDRRRLRESRDGLRLAVEASELGVWEADPRRGAFLRSDRDKAMLGYAPEEEVTHERFLDRVHPEDRAGVEAAMARALDPAGDGAYRASFRTVLPGGRLRWLSARGRALFEGDGQALRAVRFIGTTTDVTECAETERFLQDVLDSLIAFVAVLAPDGRVVYANRLCFEISGVPPEAVIGRHMADTPWYDYDAAVSARVREAAAEARAGRRPRFDVPARLADGSLLDISLSIGPLRGGDGRLLIASAVDVSERKAMEGALRASEARLRATANAGPAMIWVCDARGRAIRFNDPWHRFTGLTPERAAGDGWIAALHPDDAEPVVRAWREAIERGTFYEVEMRCRRRDGAYRWLLVRAEPLRDPSGGIVEWIGSSTDIHDLRTAEEALRTALADKDALLREVHHRVGNNLQAIWALVQLESVRLKDNPEGSERLRAIGERLDVLGRLHHRLYRSEDISRVALAPYLDELVRSLVELRGEGGRVSVEVSAEPLACDLDTAMPLGNVANELVTNSLKHAFPDGRRGGIALSLRRLPEGSVELTVADDGVGAGRDDPSVGTAVPRDPRSRGIGAARDPRSRGIGMVLVQSLARQLDAEWTVETDGGTRVRLVLPGARFWTARD